MTRKEIIKVMQSCSRICSRMCGRDCPAMKIQSDGGRLAERIAADMLEQDVPGWISVKDRLPPTRGYYLVCTYTAYYRTQCISKVFFDGKLWGSVRKRYTNITHWMPLPEPPKEEAK